MNPRSHDTSTARNSRELKLGLALYLFLCAAWIAYAPGIAGNFTFDDFPNLSGLSNINEQPGLASIGQFVFDPITGSIGRPLSLITFALQHDSWNQNPGDFIQVNILLHLLNGTLLFWALMRLLRLLPDRPPQSDALALAAALVWLISPLQSSAVLYVIQRMAVLSGTCMIMGLLLYVVGRAQAADGRVVRGFGLMTAGVAAGLGLGVLAKENAALFPLLILVTEFTLLRELPRSRDWRRWAAICLAAPLILLLGYLMVRLPVDLNAVSPLGVHSIDRALSQPRVLFSYLQKMLLPSPYSIRIMYDDIVVSSSLFSPWTTGVSLAAWLGLVGISVTQRRRYPLLAFAVLWFLASHLLESGFIPLEVAFDHRSYVAIIGICLLLVCGAARLLDDPQLRRIRFPIAMALAGYFLFMGIAQWQTSQLWGKPYELMAYWGKTQPDSRRVSYELADAHFRNGHPIAAMKEHEQAFARWPGDTAIAFGLLGKGCAIPIYPVPSIEDIKHSLAIFDGHAYSTLNLLNRIILQAEVGACDRYPLEELRTIVDLTFAVPAIKSSIPVNHHLMLSRLHYLEPNLDAALDQLDLALAARSSPAIYELAIHWAMDARQWQRARQYLTSAADSPDANPMVRLSYAPVFARLADEISLRESKSSGHP